MKPATRAVLTFTAFAIVAATGPVVAQEVASAEQLTLGPAREIGDELGRCFDSTGGCGAPPIILALADTRAPSDIFSPGLLRDEHPLHAALHSWRHAAESHRPARHGHAAVGRGRTR